jgi:hypothetical protein
MEAAYTAIIPATLAIAACPAAGRTRSAPITSAVRRAFHVRVVRLPGLAPLQGPQSVRREDDGEERSHAECDERPDEEEGSAGLGECCRRRRYPSPSLWMIELRDWPAHSRWSERWDRSRDTADFRAYLKIDPNLWIADRSTGTVHKGSCNLFSIRAVLICLVL